MRRENRELDGPASRCTGIGSVRNEKGEDPLLDQVPSSSFGSHTCPANESSKLLGSVKTNYQPVSMTSAKWRRSSSPYEIQ
jgi:hypothetical protein